MNADPRNRTRIALIAALTVAMTALSVLVLPSAASAASAQSAPSLAERLRSAPVPSLCGHPAGRLVNGRLPGIPAGQGSVSLAQRPLVRTGRVKGFGRVVVAVVNCDRGGVSWPQNVVVWTPRLRVLTGRSVMDFTHGGREYVQGLRITQRRLVIRVDGITEGDEAACCGTGMATVRAVGRRSRLKATSVHRFRERATAKAFIKRINARQWKKARAHGSAGAVDFFRARGGRFTVGQCFTHPMPPEPGVVRYCTVMQTSTGTRMVLNLSRPSFGRWRVVSGQW